jgi:lisH domain-containing protein FOPNL
MDELKSALVEALESRGTMREIKAKVRAEIFAALDEEAPRPPLPPENVLLNELIREYLEYNSYQHSLSVLALESGMAPSDRLDRGFLASELNLRDKPRGVPLLYSIIHDLRSVGEKPAAVDVASAGPSRERTYDQMPAMRITS